MPVPDDQPRWPDTIPWAPKGPGPGRWRSRNSATSWVDQLFERIQGAPDWADRSFVRQLAAMRPRHEVRFTNGAIAQTHLLAYPDGSHAIRKTFADTDRPKAEYLASLVAEAVGAIAPAVVPDPTDPEHSVIMGFVQGDMGTVHTGSQWYQLDRALSYLAHSDAGLRIGLMDILILNPDRHAENWMLSNELDTPHPWAFMGGDRGPLRRPIPIDNSETFGRLVGGLAIQDPSGDPYYIVPAQPGSYRGFANPWMQEVTGPEAALWITRGTREGGEYDPGQSTVYTYRPNNPLHPDDLPVLRKRLSALGPRFRALGMETEYRDMGARLEALGRHAGGTERMFPDE